MPAGSPARKCSGLRAPSALWGRTALQSRRQSSQRSFVCLTLRKAVLVQKLVSEAPVEALREGVLDGLARADEVVLDAALVAPGIEGLAGELRAVVGADRSRPSVEVDRSIQDACHALCGQRGVRLYGRAVLRVVIYRCEDSKRATIAEGVAEEVHRPAIVSSRRDRQCPPGSLGGALATLLPDREAPLGVQPVDALVVDGEALPAQQDREPSIAEARALLGEALESIHEHWRLHALRSVSLHRAVLPRQRARAALAELVLLLEVLDDQAARSGAYHFFPSADFSARMSSAWSATICFS